jgi:hypothetical protein
MSKVGSIQYKKLKEISPSQFSSMKNCAYKVVLAEAFDKKAMLPLSANAYMGTVLHRLLEQIAKRQILTESDLNAKFDEELKKMEDKLVLEGIHFLVPLQKNVKDFGMKKILLKRHLKPNSLPDPSAVITNRKYLSEEKYKTKDGALVGRIDLIIEDADEADIVDFKSGAVTQESFDDEGEAVTGIKEEYKIQLKLYAYLYANATNKKVRGLTLVDLAKQKYNVEFTLDECVKLFDEAKDLLRVVNESIEKSEFEKLANPSSENCRFCLYRPACSYYLTYLKEDDSLNDVTGEVIEITKYLNGNISIVVRCNEEHYTITGFGEEKHDYLISNKNKRLNIFNLKKEFIENVYSVIKTTVIYE